MKTTTRKTLLQAACLITTATGVLIALAALPVLALPMTWLADIVLWPMDGGNSLAANETRLLAAIGGGVMAGWGLMMRAIVNRLFDAEPLLVRHLMLSGLVPWFVIDSAASTLAGAPLNVVLNMVFLALFLMPLSGEVASVRHI
jgi:hypothetical protein